MLGCRAATALIALAALAGCSGEGGDGSSPTTTASAPAAESATQPGGGDAAPPQLYFTAGEQFKPVERGIPGGGAKLEEVTEALLDGPPKSTGGGTLATQIPAGTELRGVQHDDRGVATVRLSAEFTAGIPARPSARTRAEESELNARLGQLTYTLTQFPEVEEARILAGGEPVEPRPVLARSDYARPDRGPARIERARDERGASVRAVQQRLAELRYLPDRAVDGVDGYRTRQAVIAFQSWRGLERDGIVGPKTQAALDRASPPKPKAEGPARRIEVFREKGVALLIKADRVKRAIHVSTGGPGNETPAGAFEVFRKELRSWSVPFQVWLPYASYFTGGIAFHEYADVPTYPASHGCVRVPAPEAKGVYRFASIGTAVVVF